MKEGNIQVTGAKVRNIHPQTLVDDIFSLEVPVYQHRQVEKFWLMFTVIFSLNKRWMKVQSVYHSLLFVEREPDFGSAIAGEVLSL